MSFINISLDYFRNFYQMGDSINLISSGTYPTLDTVARTGIVLGDFLSSFVLPEYPQSTPQLSLYCQIIEGSGRCIEIGRSAYLLYTNPPGLDQQAHQCQIFLNMLNMTRIALQVLKPTFSMSTYVNLAIRCIDTIVRCYFLVQRNGLDSIFRASIEGTGLVTLLGAGTCLLYKGIKDQQPAFVIGSGLLLAFLTMSMKFTVNKIFDELNIQPNLTRDLCEWTFTIASASSITLVALVGCGMSRSINESLQLLSNCGTLCMGTVGCSYALYKIVRLIKGIDPVMSHQDLMDFYHTYQPIINLAATLMRT